MREKPLLLLPEGTDLLFLAPGRKGLLLDGQSNKRFEVRGLGIIETCLPFPHRFAGDTQVLGHSSLRQSDGGAQGQHSLPKGVVWLTIRGSLHACVPFRMPPKNTALRRNERSKCYP